MTHIRNSDDLSSKLRRLERELKIFNKNQTILLASGFLALATGKKFNDDIVNMVGYLALGIVSYNTIAYLFACRKYYSLKNYLDKTD